MRIRSNHHKLNFVQYKVKMAKGVRREILSCINLPIHIEACLSWLLEYSNFTWAPTSLTDTSKKYTITSATNQTKLQCHVFFKIAIACCWSWFLYKQTSEKEKASKSLVLNITYLNCVCGLPQVIWRSRQVELSWDISWESLY